MFPEKKTKAKELSFRESLSSCECSGWFVVLAHHQPRRHREEPWWNGISSGHIYVALGAMGGNGNASGAGTHLGPHLFVWCIILSFTPQACCSPSHTWNSKRGNLPPSPEKGNAMKMGIYCSLIEYFSLSNLSYLRITQGKESEIHGERARDKEERA